MTSNALVKAVARRQDFLIRLPNGTPTGAALIDTILGSTLRKKDDKATWGLVQREVIIGTIEAALNLLA